MEQGQVSRTALSSAFTRAYHAEHGSPKVFDDFLANRLLTEEESAQFTQFMLTTIQTLNPAAAAAFPDQTATLEWMMQSSGATPLMLARSRYTEECLEEAIKQGVSQYVILGAGMDTFAFRRPELVEQLQLFEVDHPATQTHKQRRLSDLAWDLPSRLHFVPVDFTRDSLASALSVTPYNPLLPTLFSWLGVSYYLTRDEVFAALRDIAAIAPAGSKVIFDYLDTDAFIPRKAAPRALGMLWFTQQVGEPMKTGFDPLTLDADLAGIGFRLHEDLSPMDIQRRYFSGRIDHYRSCEHAHYACIKVK